MILNQASWTNGKVCVSNRRRSTEFAALSMDSTHSLARTHTTAKVRKGEFSPTVEASQSTFFKSSPLPLDKRYLDSYSNPMFFFIPGPEFPRKMHSVHYHCTYKSIV